MRAVRGRVGEFVAERTAQFALTAIAGTSVVARLIGGRVVQRVPIMRLAVGLVFAQAIALFVIGVAETTWVLFAAIVCSSMRML